MRKRRYQNHWGKYGVIFVLQLKMIFITLEFLIIVAVSCLPTILTQDLLSHGHAH